MPNRAEISAALMIASLLAGAPLSADEPLWREIEPGMTIEQVRTLYPVEQGEGRKVEHHKSKTELHGFMAIGRCKPRVEVLHPRGQVTGVYIWMRPQGAFRPMCEKDARAAVLAKFGPPATQENRPPQPGELYSSEVEILTWATPHMTVTWHHREINDAWHIHYIAAGPAGASEL